MTELNAFGKSMWEGEEQVESQYTLSRKATHC
jgi:hypothetical protein